MQMSNSPSAKKRSIDTRSLLSNTAMAFASQFVAMLASCMTSLIVPKLLSVSNFGYWQLFIFYSSYVGFFALGAIDGVYLINGGKTRESIDKRSINSQFWISTGYVALFSFLFALAASRFVSEAARVEVLYLTALYSVLSQMSAGLGYILQTINETKSYSKSVMLDRGSFAAFLVILIALKCTSFEPYIIFFIVSKLVCFIYCANQMRDFPASGFLPLGPAIQETLASIKVGIKLMFAGIASMLITGIARQAIDSNWGINVFAKVSMALSLVNFFSMFVNQASMVLFPALRRGTKEEQVGLYINLRDALELFMPYIYLCYFPAVIILGSWLPQYTDSLTYFAVLLPICAYDAKMSICGTTYFKVLRLERKLLLINLSSVAMSAIFTMVSLVFNSLNCILYSMVLSIALRANISEFILNKRQEIAHSRLAIGEAGFTLVFLIACATLDIKLAFVIVLLALTIHTLANKRLIKDILKKTRGVFSAQ